MKRMKHENLRIQSNLTLVSTAVASAIVAIAVGLPTLASAASATYPVIAGGSTTLPVSFRWNCYYGTHGPVNDSVQDMVSVDAVPSGSVTGTTNPNPSIANVDITTVTVNAAPNATPGTYGFIVTGFGSVTACEPYTWPNALDVNTPYPIYIQVLPGAPPRYTSAQKATFQNIAHDLDKASLGVGAAGYACKWAGSYANRCRFIGIGIAVADKVAEDHYKDLAKEPPDPDWTEVASPVPMPFQPIAADGTYDQASANAANALMQNLSQQVGLMDAIVTAVNRSASAYAAGDINTSNMQLMVASQYNNELSALATAWPGLQSAFTAALASDGFPLSNLTSADESAFQSSVAANGLSADFVAAAAYAGADSATISEWASEIVAATPSDARAIVKSGVRRLDQAAALLSC
jgi:hypothetical protein